jgi:predicted small metal-binding protein
MKTLSCRETGFECNYVAKGWTEEEVITNGAEHVIKEHGVKAEDMTAEMKNKIRAFIRDI